MSYPQAITEYFTSIEVAGIAAELLYLIFAETKPERGFDAVWLFDKVMEHPETYRNLAALSQQQFLWRLTMLLRTLGGWKKQSKNSHYWWRESRGDRNAPALPGWWIQWCMESPPVKKRLSSRIIGDHTVQRRIFDYLGKRDQDQEI